MNQRVTVIDSVYYQSADTPATSVDSRFTIIPSTDEQPYLRRIKVGKEWTEIDLGWLKELDYLSQILIKNEEEIQTGKIPTVEELTALYRRYVDIHIGDSTPKTGHIRIHPSESCRFRPRPLADNNSFFVRLNPNVDIEKATITIFAVGG